MASIGLCLVATLMLLSGACEARHLQAKAHDQRDDWREVWDEQEELPAAAINMPGNNDELAPIDIIKSAKPVWFVPINSRYYFGVRPEPCDDGFRRDRFGVCREVW